MQIQTAQLNGYIKEKALNDLLSSTVLRAINIVLPSENPGIIHSQYKSCLNSVVSCTNEQILVGDLTCRKIYAQFHSLHGTIPFREAKVVYIYCPLQQFICGIIH